MFLFNVFPLSGYELIRYLGTISLYDFNGFLVLSIRNVDLVILTCVYLN